MTCAASEFFGPAAAATNSIRGNRDGTFPNQLAAAAAITAGRCHDRPSRRDKRLGRERFFIF